MDRYKPQPRRRKRIASVFLAFFFGVFGVHKFYLNSQGAGVFYIMLFVMSVNIIGFPVSFLLGMIDAMKLLMLTDEEFDHKYNTKGVRTGQRYDRGRRSKSRRRAEPDFRRKSSQKTFRTKRANRTERSRSNLSKKMRKENAYIKSGITKYKDFDLQDAIEDFNKGLEIEPNNVALHFNIACAYSLLEKKDLAFDHLSLAVVNGLKDVSKIDTHEDLAYLRIQKEFEGFKNSGYKRDVKTSNPRTSKASENQESDLLSRLNKLAELRKRGLLSEREFLMEKEKLIG